MASCTPRSLATRCLAVALLAGSAAPALGELSSGQSRSVTEAVTLPVEQAVPALRALFEGNLPQLLALAEEATLQAPALCGRIMSEGSRASPRGAGDLAAAILAVAPECEAAVARVLAEDVAPAAGAAGSLLRPIPSEGAAAAPALSVTARATAETPAAEVASPTSL